MRAVGVAAAVLSMAVTDGAAEDQPFVECTAAELAHAAPELAGTHFAENQKELDGVLHAAGEKLHDMLAKLADVYATEDIHEIRTEDPASAMGREEEFRYVIRTLAEGAPEQFVEGRLDAKTGAEAPDAKPPYLVIGHFYKLVRFLLPEFKEQSRFRLVGRWSGKGQDYWVVAFAQKPEALDPRSHIGLGGGRTAAVQGIAWIDAGSNRLARLRVDLLGHPEGFPLASLTTDMRLAEVRFSALGTVLWLPATVTVDGRYTTGVLHSVHRYTEYRLSGGEGTGSRAGLMLGGISVTEDAYELLARGVSLLEQKEPGEAVTALRDAVRLKPDLAPAGFQLAAALRASGDVPGAITELKAALQRAPDSGPAHNLMGILLFEHGDPAAAVIEMRESARLQPKDATVRFNLAQGLEKTGDAKAALEEYKAAADLAPDNAKFKAQYERLQSAAARPVQPQTAGPTIKVEVRQVLVPVVVTDKEGHHMTGLKQADFRVFEDGVEQKISGFSVEDASVPGSPAPSRIPAAAKDLGGEHTAAPPSAVPVRRTYLICIDTLHTAFASLNSIRESLAKMFHSQGAGDSQYVVLSLGDSTQMVQGPTSDPKTALQAVASKNFQKIFMSSRKSSVEADLRQYRQELEEARKACDSGDPSCNSRKMRLPAEANHLTQQDRTYALAFLGQFRGLVQQLSKQGGRRAIILFSDGFGMVPGKEAWDLLAVYFPEIPESGLRALDRMTDLEPVLRVAANNNIPVYTIDARGLYTSPFFDASNSGATARLAPAVMSVMNQNASDAGDTLAEVANATGGTAFQNSNDMLGGLERALADGRQYYMLAYVPSNSENDGKFRRITVQVSNGKLLITAKRGYWAESGK
jgi:VWFA-related protein